MTKNSLVLMDAGRVMRSLKRVAHQILEANKDDKPIALLGINERGYLIAKKLSGYLEGIGTGPVRSIRLLLEKEGDEMTEVQNKDLSDAFIVLTDDVIFTGTTMFKALKLLSEYLELTEVHTVVLVDRGHRKLPVDAQFVGLDLPTKLNEHVSLIIEDEDIRGVELSTSG